MKKIIAFIVALGVICSTGTIALADTSTTTATTSPTVQSFISQLQILRQLRQGMSGDDVKQLQSYLASQPDLYPEGLITGFFGPATARAIARYQKELGLESVGFVGPKTLEKLNEDLTSENENGDNQGDNRPCMAIPPGHLIAPGFLKHQNKMSEDHGDNQGDNQGDNEGNHGHEDMRGDDSQIIPPTGTSTVIGTSTPGLPLPPCHKLPPGIEHKIGTTTIPTWPPIATSTSTAAPIISSVTAMPTSMTSGRIVWLTDQFATSKIIYSTTSPVLTASSSLSATANGYTIGHAINLTNLTASTTYYIVAISTGMNNQTATSSEVSFTTFTH